MKKQPTLFAQLAFAEDAQPSAPIDAMYAQNGIMPRATCGGCRYLEGLTDGHGPRSSCRLAPERPRASWSRTWAACGLFQPVHLATGGSR